MNITLCVWTLLFKGFYCGLSQGYSSVSLEEKNNLHHLGVNFICFMDFSNVTAVFYLRKGVYFICSLDFQRFFLNMEGNNVTLNLICFTCIG